MSSIPLDLSERVKRDFSNMTVLLYHEVTDFPERAKQVRKIGPTDSLTTRQFEEQMVLLSERPYTRVVAGDDIFGGAENNSKKIVLTFDDGLIGNYLFAFNILKKYGFKAIFFATVNSISRNRYMSWEQLSVLHKDGHLIQSHTMTHPMLGECDEKRITYEVEASKKIIEDKIGGPVKYLSLPFGSLNERVTKIAKDTGYKAIFTSSCNSRNSKSGLYQFGRVHVKDTYSLRKFERLIDSNPTEVLLTRTNEAWKRLIKEIIGLNSYRKLYRFMYRIEL